MPCADSSSSFTLSLDEKGHFQSFEFAKITCGQSIAADTGYGPYCRGKSVEQISALSFETVCQDLNVRDEEGQFILYLEWDALRCVIGQYLGLQETVLDLNRCQISSIEHTPESTEISLILLPPQGMPKILPCHLGDCRH